MEEKEAIRKQYTITKNNGAWIKKIGLELTLPEHCMINEKVKLKC